MTGTLEKTYALVSGVTPPIEIPAGFILNSIEVPELTATAFTITHCRKIDGTFLTLKDPLGIYGGTAGEAVSFATDTTSLGLFAIPPALGSALWGWMRIALTGSTETGGLTVIFRNIA